MSYFERAALSPRKAYPAILLFAGIALLYAKSAGFDFINLDDPAYVVQNEMVKGGLSASGVKEALLAPVANYYIPLTWLSLMADYSLFGGSPAGFHATNVLLHSLNALLLFLFLLNATDSPVNCFLASALWAAHPLRVESVAWVTARKDVLFLFFLLLALNFWLCHAKKGGWRWYWAAFFAALAACLAKPAAVVAPFILLVVDYWPLGRFNGERARAFRLWAEKLPFFALSAVFSLLTLQTQSSSISPSGIVTPLDRFCAVATSYWRYIGKTIWPSTLVLEDGNASWRMDAGLAALVLAAIFVATLVLYAKRKAAPQLFSGWIWYLAALLPVSGLVSVGMNSVADRFSYLPSIGLFTAAVWGVGAFVQRTSGARKALFGAGLLLLAAFSVLSFVQLGHWRDSETLFRYHVEARDSIFARKGLADALKAKGDYLANSNLLASISEAASCDSKAAWDAAEALELAKRFEEARFFYLRAIDIAPKNPDYHFGLARISLAMGDKRAAAASLTQALALNPEHFDSLLATSRLYMEEERLAKAVGALEKARKVRPDDRFAARELGFAYGVWGMGADSVKNLRDAVAIDTKDPESNFLLASALSQGGDMAGAMKHYLSALEASPENPAYLYGCGVSLERLGRAGEALEYYRRAVAANPEGDYGRAAKARLEALR